MRIIDIALILSSIALFGYTMTIHKGNKWSTFWRIAVSFAGVTGGFIRYVPAPFDAVLVITGLISLVCMIFSFYGEFWSTHEIIEREELI